MKLRFVALSMALGLCPTLVWASPVNMERIASKPDTPGWSASLDFKGGLREGNIKRRDVSFGGGVQHRTFHPDLDTTRPAFFRDRWLLSSNITLARLNDKDITDNGFMHARYTRMVLPRLGPEVFIQAQYNAFTNLRARMLTGGGARFDLVHRNLVGIWGGTGYMVEYEINAVEAGDPHPSETVNHRWTSYLSTRFNVIDDQLLFGTTTYVQPRFDDFTDLRVQVGAQLEARVGPVFSLGADFEVRHDSRPPRGIAQTDITLSSYLRFRFG